MAGRADHPGGIAFHTCLLYTSDAADERSSVDLGGRRIITKKKEEKKKKKEYRHTQLHTHYLSVRLHTNTRLKKTVEK